RRHRQGEGAASGRGMRGRLVLVTSWRCRRTLPRHAPHPPPTSLLPTPGHLPGSRKCWACSENQPQEVVGPAGIDLTMPPPGVNAIQRPGSRPRRLFHARTQHPARFHGFTTNSRAKTEYGACRRGARRGSIGEPPAGAGRPASASIARPDRTLNSARRRPRHLPSHPDPRPATASMPMMKTSTKTLLALSAAAAFGGFAATGLNQMLDAPALAQPATTVGVPAAPAPTLPTAVDGTPVPSLAPMLKKVLPAVVSVNTKQRVRVNTPFGDDPVFRRIFGIPQERIARSLGSGVIIDAQRGLVLTNNHVVEDADEVQVTLADGRTLKAEFVGNDADTDVALMRIPAQDLTAIPVADSDRLQIGDFVVAIGNPFGVGQTVTSGIVSAVGRNNLPGAGFQNF